MNKNKHLLNTIFVSAVEDVAGNDLFLSVDGDDKVKPEKTTNVVWGMAGEDAIKREKDVTISMDQYSLLY